MSDHDEQTGRRLGEAMEAGAPSSGTTGTDRLESVHRRRRAARGRVVAAGGVAALAVAAIAVVGVQTLGGDSEGEVAGPSRGVEETTAAPAGPTLACPADGVVKGGADPREPGGEETLPADPVNAVLCPGELGLESGEAEVELTDGLDELVALVNDAPIDDPALTMCTQELGPDYLLVLGYEDGSVVTSAVEDYGCQWVWTGGAARSIAPDVLALAGVDPQR